VRQQVPMRWQTTML